MGKNWLIRTKSNHILGPISKEKVLDLYTNGSIKQDDEVCCGNGYWFFIRESSLVEKYLVGNNPQSFNPVSEAKDVLTASSGNADYEPTRDDITMVGGIDLTKFNASNEAAPAISEPKVEIESTVEVPAAIPQKKKARSDSKAKQSTTPKTFKKQNYFRYIGIIAFLFLVLIIYFRKSILRSFFSSEISSQISALVLPDAYAQDEGSAKKKKILKSEVSIEGVTFKPSIGLEGLRVVSTFDIESFNCQKLESSIFQLAIILYPTDLFNEKFLLNVRNCMPRLDSEHPVKLWILSQKTKHKPKSENQEKMDLLNSVVNSQFNLITDLKMKASVIELIAENPSHTNLEKLIKSYLYLIIGNTTHSDNILKEMIQQTPREFYQGVGSDKSLFHKTAKENLDKILKKIARHPADRLTFYLFSSYLKNFFNQVELMEYVDEIELNDLDTKLDLAYTAKIAPDLVGYLRLSNMNEKSRMEVLRSEKYSFKMQSLWVWAFLEIDPLISESMIDTIKDLDKRDPLWTVYLLSNEKISDMYFKKGGLPVSRRRQFLRGHLEDKKDFMLTLYKLIEIGDINQELVREVSQFMIHE